MWQLIHLTLLSVLRDRVFHAVFGAGALLVLLVPVFSSFSMRQVQESSVGLSLSASSLILFVLSVHLGSSLIFRDVDKRYTHSVLSLPISRTKYLVSRYVGLILFLALCALLLAVCSLAVIFVCEGMYPSGRTLNWSVLFVAMFANFYKFAILTSIAVFFSSLSSSLTFPIFCTLAVYFAGSASQEVYEYLLGNFGESYSALLLNISKFAYYALPNFTAFDFHIQAIYGLPLDIYAVLGSFLYGSLYAAFVVWCAVWFFSRRELP